MFRFGLAYCLVMQVLAQVLPPNEDYTNRTILVGGDLSFSGTLAGTTYEANPQIAASYFDGLPPGCLPLVFIPRYKNHCF